MIPMQALPLKKDTRYKGEDNKRYDFLNHFQLN